MRKRRVLGLKVYWWVSTCRVQVLPVLIKCPSCHKIFPHQTAYHLLVFQSLSRISYPSTELPCEITIQTYFYWRCLLTLTLPSPSSHSHPHPHPHSIPTYGCFTAHPDLCKSELNLTSAALLRRGTTPPAAPLHRSPKACSTLVVGPCQLSRRSQWLLPADSFVGLF